jgi:uncharacterized RDD family membrane protein YckC
MTENPYAPPSADLTPPEASTDAVPLATRGRRLGAAILDTLLMLAIQVPVLIAAGYFEAARQGQVGVGGTLAASLFGMVVYLAINGYLLAKRGQTVGKRLLNIQIVGIRDERIIPFGRVIGLRVAPIWAVSLIPAIGSLLAVVDALFIFRKDRRCLHDLIASTHVVEYQAA